MFVSEFCTQEKLKFSFMKFHFLNPLYVSTQVASYLECLVFIGDPSTVYFHSCIMNAA
jgi:hypothetical protein